MRYRLFYVRNWLTPAMQEKVRKERSESPDSTPEIRYKRKKVVEDREFETIFDLKNWIESQTKTMVGMDGVLEEYVSLWDFSIGPFTNKPCEMEMEFLATVEQELPLT